MLGLTFTLTFVSSFNRILITGLNAEWKWLNAGGFSSFDDGFIDDAIDVPLFGLNKKDGGGCLIQFNAEYGGN